MYRRDLIKIFDGDVKLTDSVLGNPNFKFPKKAKCKDWLQTFQGAFTSRKPKCLHILGHIRKALGMEPLETIQWKDFTKLNLRKISDYLNSHLAPNTANTEIHVLMSVLNQFSEEGVIPAKNIAKSVQTKSVPSQHIALTADEMERFDAYEPKTEAAKDVKALFMRACYTGARCSDAINLGEDNIIHTEQGDLLTYVSKKTTTEVTLPVHANLPKYLAPIKPRSKNEQLYVLHNICKAIGMTDMVSLYVGGRRVTKPRYELVSMHTARRTFCTLLADMGISVEQIRMLAGHSSSAMTDRYICLNGKNISKDVMKFFGGKPKKTAKVIEMKDAI